MPRGLFEAEHAQRADDARDAQVVVVEAADPVSRRSVEVGGPGDGGEMMVVVVGGSGPLLLLLRRRRRGGFEAVES